MIFLLWISLQYATFEKYETLNLNKISVLKYIRPFPFISITDVLIILYALF